RRAALPARPDGRGDRRGPRGLGADRARRVAPRARVAVARARRAGRIRVVPVDHERLTELFTQAMDLDRKAQAELVMNLGHEDPELAQELAQLLSADDEIVTALRTAGL